MQPEWTNASSSNQGESAGSKTGAEIKRSSWNAGMAADLVQPPPGSPAAWQGRRRSRPQSMMTQVSRSDGAPFVFNPLNVPGSPPPRNPSPVRGSSHLTIPSLQPIRAVSGSALGPDHDLQPSEEKKLEEKKHRSQSPQRNPFNFTPTYVTTGKPSSSSAGNTRASQRRGHHYKHSSVSMNFFQEPEERVPLSIPVSLAVPTLREYYQSITKPQYFKLGWCFLRMLVAISVYSVGSPIQSVAPLAHLLAYETVVSTSVACVEVLSNFEVWNKSTLRLPFALKRVEVLVAFGLSAILLFIGGDVVSHIIQSLATGGGHHHHHQHDDHLETLKHGLGVQQKRKHFALLTASVVSIFPSAYRQGSANPLAMCTLVIALVVMIVPLLKANLASMLDTLLTPVIAFTMIFVGYTSSKLFSGMLAMSYGGPDRSEVISEMVSSDPSVAHVSDISLWQVHHDLWLASMRITMSGDAADERRVREQAAKAVRETMDVKDVEWETTIEISRTELD